MEKGAALRLTLIIVIQVLASQSIANPVECREGEYLGDHGVCIPCKECGPGFELSKECGYGEGREAECTPCQPRRFKDSWGPHGCKSCLSCALINRAQKSNCSTTSDATCGGCFPGFYSKTQIGGFQDLECVPCTKQTPPSEPQCLSRIGLEESSTEPAQDPALVVLTSSALVLLALILLTVAILYCQQFWKSQCQHVFLRSQNVSGQRVTFRTSAGPTGIHELPPDACSLDIRNFRSPYRPPEGPVRALQFIPGVDVPGSHLPHPQPDTDWSKMMTVTSTTPQARSPLEVQPLIGTPGLHSCSFHGGFSEGREDRSRGPDGPGQPSSCARESQHCWPHAPVECTELDLQAFSAWAGKGTAEIGMPGKRKPTTEVLSGSACPAAQAGRSLEAASALCSSFQNRTLESGEPLRSSSSNVSLEQPPL
ncbi:tumor necrosis factor receptor superfamily member 27 isoform X1 [Pantherophis guttatus]|uniref:Tumor necrosis factor receptor superfamily member 27 isoform X1 n=1 Tax=Pantherophis guttatus TaxID=94885 RepID=A0A6P9DFE7_PANGU|nr:tumor necrosis factor receptor superfamily member 27 isoform X1 [Pantherophis guttatus]